MNITFTWKRLIAVAGIAATLLAAGCAATPQPAAGAGATSPTPWCVQGRYGGADALANCDRGFTENSR